MRLNSDNPTVELDGAGAFEVFFLKPHRRMLGFAFVLSGQIEVATRAVDGWGRDRLTRDEPVAPDPMYRPLEGMWSP